MMMSQPAPTTDRNASVSPTRRTSFGNALATLGAKITRTLSRDEATLTADSETRSVSTVASTAKDRSQSRGREVYQSSGRGGAGNIRQASLSRDARPPGGPDDFSVVRGREPVPAATRSFSTGRGGVGNIRSPSRDPTTTTTEEEQDVLNAAISAAQNAPHSSGRGGAGNISLSHSLSHSISHSHSLSRSRSRGPRSPIRSTGRGGVGNMIDEGAAAAVEEHEEEEEEARRNANGREHGGGGASASVHSTARGGTANLTAAPSPPVEHPHAHAHVHVRAPSPPRVGEYESTGRGGAGNMVRDRARSAGAAGAGAGARG
ncbi:putative protein of unknown function (DUF3602) [Lyophyllum shimeji]|uniref:Uncharacterized protein n=1 Tax=Lyophyllum shimeji TaxID=47721 RepID=A0A9P3UHP9_LYOSH|nr:putative protein of unknown function (DUF3602) [Lyophyllum shimeji]